MIINIRGKHETGELKNRKGSWLDEIFYQNAQEIVGKFGFAIDNYMRTVSVCENDVGDGSSGCLGREGGQP